MALHVRDLQEYARLTTEIARREGAIIHLEGLRAAIGARTSELEAEIVQLGDAHDELSDRLGDVVKHLAQAAPTPSKN